jgi:hypothetical protein
MHREARVNEDAAAQIGRVKDRYRDRDVISAPARHSQQTIPLFPHSQGGFFHHGEGVRVCGGHTHDLHRP